MIERFEPMRRRERDRLCAADIEHAPFFRDRPMPLAHEEARAGCHQRDKRLKAGPPFLFGEMHPNGVEHDDVKRLGPRLNLREVRQRILQPSDLWFGVQLLRTVSELISGLNCEDGMPERNEPGRVTASACADV